MSARVVSLVPSTTETLLAWGVEVLACTRYCEQPALRKVGGTKDPDIAAIVALAPDLVVMDREENRKEDAEALVAAGVTVHATHVRSLADVPATLDALAGAVGVAPPPVELAEPDPHWARAFVPIWRRPWMSLGGSTYGSTLLAHLGVDNVLADGPPYPSIELDDVAVHDPDLILLPSEPYPFRHSHGQEIRVTMPRAHAVQLDGRDLFWWGVRTPGAIDRLRGALRPALPPR